MTCWGKNYLLVVYYIPIHWEFFRKKCIYDYICMKKETLINFPSEVQLIRRREIEI